MRASVIIELGWCGFGYNDGIMPDLRLVVLRLAWCRGSLLDRMRGWGEALATPPRGGWRARDAAWDAHDQTRRGRDP